MNGIQTSPPRVEEFGLDDASVREARVITSRYNSYEALFFVGCGLAFFGSLCAGAHLVSFAILVLAWPLLAILQLAVPDYKQARDVIQRFQRFQSSLNAYEAEQQRRQREYWLSFSPLNFEREVAAVFDRLGVRSAVTPASGDEGIDIRVEAGGERGIVQCKRYADKATPALVRELYGALTADGADLAILVCTGGFTSGVRTFSADKPIHLVDMDGLLRLVQLAQHRAEDSKRFSLSEIITNVCASPASLSCSPPATAGMQQERRPGSLSSAPQPAPSNAPPRTVSQGGDSGKEVPHSAQELSEPDHNRRPVSSSSTSSVQVDSSCISAVRYDQAVRRLYVTFRDGSQYVYYGVPSAVYADFLNAKSKGRYFNGTIADRYPSALMSRGQSR